MNMASIATSSVLCLLVPILLFFMWKVLVHASSNITCPECLNRDNRPAPCPTCGDAGAIKPGSNPMPRGTGFQGTGRGERQVLQQASRTHSNAWWKNYGGKGYIN